jgi:YHS domain-containing protein
MWNTPCTARAWMKSLVPLLALALACSRPAAPKSSQASASATSTDVQTIDNADPRPALLDPPPMLTDEGIPTAKPKSNVTQADAPPPPTVQDEALRASLPFAPAIAMDPVDGSKISIRANTPRFEVKGKIFYFSSEPNKAKFTADPDLYMKGVFSHL